MIERGGSGRSSLTDWQSMDAVSMWAVVQDHETANHWRQVSGWAKVCDLAQLHLRRLQTYRDGLARAWPPGSSAASQAYLAELDGLIERVTRTHDAASANLTALAAATRAIDSARSALRPVFDDYVTKLGQKQAYEETVRDPKALMGSRLPDAPVTDADLERINARARSIMYGLSGELQQAQVMLRRPPQPPVRDATTPDTYGAGAQSPVIPPIVPVPMPTAGTASSVSRTTTPAKAFPTPKAPKLGPVLGGVAPVPTKPPIGQVPASGPGPVLGGTTPSAPPTNPALPGLTFPRSPGSASQGVTPTPPAITGPTSRSGGSLRGKPGPVGRVVGGGGGGSAHMPPSSPPRAMPPGGLIGGLPGAGFSQPVGGAPARRVNPIGGVIGGGGAGTSPTGSAGSRPSAGRGSQFGIPHALPPFNGAPGVAGGSRGTTPHISGGPYGSGSSGTYGGTGLQGRSDRQNDDTTDVRRRDPDHPWETDKGVDPVVRPPKDHGPIDPGPAIGFSR